MSLQTEFFFKSSFFSVQIWSNRDSVEIKLGQLKLAVFTITVYVNIIVDISGITLEGDVIALDQPTSLFSPPKATRMWP